MDDNTRLSPLHGAFVVLGVTGGIAAYKAVEVCRRLVDAGAHVVPVMTESATHFVGALTFSALASEPVRTAIFDGDDPIPHTHLGQAADLVIVCPATANSIASYAAGLAGDLLGSTLLATEAPVLLCPAMHTEMWRHHSVRDNLDLLVRRGVEIVEPERGRLAGGDVGEGRLAEPSEIVRRAELLLGSSGDLAGRHVVISAGGTREPIDPVRFLSNRSSGRQGYALAEAARARGAQVTLVSAAELAPPRGIDLVPVETATEMREAVLGAAPTADIVVMAAAIADFRPKDPSGHKLKRRDGVPDLVLEEVPDFFTELVARRSAGQVLIAFAAETDDPIENGRRKLASMGADAIAINDVSLPGVGFGHETNALRILDRLGGERDVPLTSKRVAADAVLDVAVVLLKQSEN